MNKRALIQFFYDRNYIMTPEFLQQLSDDFDYSSFLRQHRSLRPSEQVVLLTETKFSSLFLEVGVAETGGEIEVLQSYEDEPQKREVKDFVSYMKMRYNALRKVLLQRGELQNALSIAHALTKGTREEATVIGLVSKKEETKNGSWVLELEDPTGTLKIIVSAQARDLLGTVDEIVLDEVIGVTGVTGTGVLYAKKVYFPEFPMIEYKKTEDDVALVFISDLHVGSKLFAKEEFERFLCWINGEYGTEEQRGLARKVKYLIISGDLIDGVGIYPGQEKELTMQDVYQQYDALGEYLSQIRSDIKMVLCGGNHDALRLSEPQPPLSREFARSLYKLKNVTIVSNPALVRVHKMFDILLYHGFCFDYYLNNVEYLRKAGGYDASDVMLEFALRKRHIAPTHISTLYIPDPNRDPLVIERIPDFFVSGHIHYDVKVRTYKNVTLIGNCSFQYKTTFQQKLGHTNVTWGKAVVVSLKTRAVTVLDFKEEAPDEAALTLPEPKHIVGPCNSS